MNIDTTGLSDLEIERINAADEEFKLSNRTDDEIKELIKEIENNALSLYEQACNEESLSYSVRNYLDRRID